MIYEPYMLISDIEMLTRIENEISVSACNCLEEIVRRYEQTPIKDRAVKQMRQQYGYTNVTRAIALDSNEFKNNAFTYRQILTRELQQQVQYQCYPSPVAYNNLFSPAQPFQQSTVLHQNNGRNLTVSDMLSVVSYANKVAQVASGQTYNPSNDTLTALKAIDLALNNQPCDKPTNKALHLANDVIQRMGHQNPTIGLIADLAIDFLVRS